MQINFPLKQKSLIIGGDGFIGSALASHLSNLQVEVFKTTRNIKKVKENVLYFNMEDGVEKFNFPPNINTVYICATEANIEKCQKNPSKTYLINTQAPLNLAKEFIKKDIFIIFLSTNAVFEGESPRKKITDTPNPKTHYGLQKLEAELGLKQISDNTLVVRLTKILSAHSPLLKNWLERLCNNKDIQPFSDMTVSPVHIYYLTEALILLGEKRCGGMVQISGEEDITYENLARQIVNTFSFSQNLIRPVCSKNSKIDIPYQPLYTSLDTSEIETRLKLYPQRLENFLENIFLEYNK